MYAAVRRLDRVRTARASPAASCASPRSRARSRLLAADGPDAYYRGPIAEAIAGAVAAGGGRARGVGPRATTRGSGRSRCGRRYRGVEIAELPPPTQGVSALEALRILDGFDDLGQRDAADARARSHRGVQGRDGRPRPLDHRSRRTCRSTPTTLFADEWIARAAGVDRPDARGHTRARHDRSPAARRTCAPPTPTGCSSASSSRTSCTSARGCTCPSGASTSTTGASRSRSIPTPSERARAEQASDAHADPRDGAARRRALARVRLDGRRRAGRRCTSRSSATSSTTTPTRPMPSPRRAGVRTSTAGRSASRRASPDEVVTGLRSRGHDVTTTVAYDSGMGHAHAIWRTPRRLRRHRRSTRGERGTRSVARDPRVPLIAWPT